jgi:histidine triad (HIT) family protein
MSEACIFCRIAAGDLSAAVVLEDDDFIGFLDHRPLFPGHVLLVPRTHIATLADLPEHQVGPLFANARLLAGVVEKSLGAEGSFVAVNNRVSQSVPHLHVHIVPRRKGDGLRGFFWPRQKYASPEEMERTRLVLHEAVRKMREVPR